MQISSVPVGYVLGQGLAIGNIAAATSANRNFKNELLKYNNHGMPIKNWETVYGPLGVKSDGFDAIKVKLQ
ncbi:MAG: hypothetical protein ACXVAY_06955 [Mucilaginibacter sp.]